MVSVTNCYFRTEWVVHVSLRIFTSSFWNILSYGLASKWPWFFAVDLPSICLQNVFVPIINPAHPEVFYILSDNIVSYINIKSRSLVTTTWRVL
jgi:hypothetical protein